MRKIPPSLDPVFFLLSQAAATFVGCVLFTIGLSGIFGLRLDPIDRISFLTQPSGLGVVFDQRYWIALTIVGGWLVLFAWPRLAAVIAIFLIVAKWLILNDLTSPGLVMR